MVCALCFYLAGAQTVYDLAPSNSKAGRRNSPNSGQGYSNNGSGYSYGDTFTPRGSGTCFALSADGYLATCYHVVEHANTIMIRGINGEYSKLYHAKVVATDNLNDLAILKVDDVAFTAIRGIPYSVSSTVADVGEEVFVLGYPLRAVMGDEIKLTNGLISSKTGYQGDATSYQTSATIQFGNSGGPLFDSDGSVIGVVNARLAVESASYAIKSTYLTSLADSIDRSIIPVNNNQLRGRPLKEMVREISRFVYILEFN